MRKELGKLYIYVSLFLESASKSSPYPSRTLPSSGHNPTSSNYKKRESPGDPDPNVKTSRFVSTTRDRSIHLPRASPDVVAASKAPRSTFA